MRVLVLAAHPDDETLGCGGTLLKHRDAGDAVSWLIATEPREPDWSKDLIARKLREVEDVARAYGITAVHRLGFETTMLDRVPLREVVSAIRKEALREAPDVVYCVGPADVHSDHRILFEAAASAFKPFQPEPRPRRFLVYETLSSTDAAPPQFGYHFAPTVYVDIGAQIDRKLETLRLYATEVHAAPFPRSEASIRALATVRGATIGVPYAEAFALVREIG